MMMPLSPGQEEAPRLQVGSSTLGPLVPSLGDSAVLFKQRFASTLVVPANLIMRLSADW